MRTKAVLVALGVMGLVSVGAAFRQQAKAPAAPAAPATTNPIVVLETIKGDVEFELYPQDAPKSVDHILKLVRRDFYRGLRFHWVQPGIVQFGDPTTRNMTLRENWGKGSSGNPIGVSEVGKKSFTRGSIGLQYFFGDPKEADSQIFICKGDSPNLNGKYTLIGKVVKGMDVVDKLEVPDMLKVAYVKGEKK